MKTKWLWSMLFMGVLSVLVPLGCMSETSVDEGPIEEIAEAKSELGTDWVQVVNDGLDNRDTGPLAARLDEDAVMHFNAIPAFEGRDAIVAAFAGASAPWTTMDRVVTRVWRGANGTLTAEGTFDATFGDGVNFGDGLLHHYRFCQVFTTHWVWVPEVGLFEMILEYNLYIDLSDLPDMPH